MRTVDPAKKNRGGLSSRARTKRRSRAAERDNDLATFETCWMRDPVAAGISKKVLALQKQLQGAVDQRAWLLYLAIEDAINRRHARLLALAREFWRVPDCKVQRRASNRSRS